MKTPYIKRLAALFLVLVLLFSLQTAALAALPAETGEPEEDYTGKTVILHTNDVHGEIGGYAKIAALRDALEARGAEVLLADAGDFSQGDPYVNRTEGLDAIELMNAAGYDLAAVGNHEFDYGVDRLLENLEAAEFPVLSANISRDGEKLFQTRALIRTESGLNIGFLGLTTPETMTAATPALVRGLSFMGPQELLDCAQGEIDALREEGADLVIALTHLGTEDLGPVCPLSPELYAGATGLDFIIDAHSHTVMTAGEAGEPIQSTGTKFQYIGVLVIDNGTKAIEKNFLISTEGLAEDETVAALAASIRERVDAELMTPVAVSEVELEGAKQVNRSRATNNGDLTTDAMLWYVKRAGTELAVPEDHLVALMNGGSIRAAMGPGEVTMKDVMTVHPFGDDLYVVYATGAQLLEALEASACSTPEPLGGFPHMAGLSWTLDLSREFDRGELYPNSTFYAPKSINRVSIDSVNAEPFSLTDTYAILVNEFVATGGDTYGVFAACESRDLCVRMDDVVLDYIREGLGGVISAERYGRVRGNERQVVGAAAVLCDALDYADPANWAYLAEGEDKAVDVFLICPTVDTRSPANALDLNDKLKSKFVNALNMEKGIYADTGRLYSPYYRQQSIAAYTLSGAEREQARENAFLDVSAAFRYYLENENGGRPFILAGFSQGSEMCLELLKAYFGGEEGAALRQQLVAVYALGWGFTEETAAQYPQIVPAAGETDTGTVICFDCEDGTVEDTIILPAGSRSYSINPLNWRTDGEKADKSLNLGAVLSTGAEPIPALCGAWIEDTRGALVVTDVSAGDYPPVLDVFPQGAYHIYDYMFFFENLRENVAKRTAAYLGKSAFTDVAADAWYAPQVIAACRAGLMQGRTEDAFCPGEALTRAELATVLWRLEGEPETAGSPGFSDVTPDAWYAPALAWASAEKLALGDETGTFRPNDPCTREELAAMLYRYVQYRGGGFRGLWMFRLEAADRDEISEWAYEAMCWLSMNGVIQGVEEGVLAPRAAANRAQAAVMLLRLEEVLTQLEPAA